MTTLLWVSNDGLYSDQRYVTTIDKENLGIITNNNPDGKIRLSKCKTFAYGCTGQYSLLLSDDIELVLKNWLMKNQNIITTAKVPKIADNNILINGHLFLMTKEYTWIIYEDGASKINKELFPFHAIGSGGLHAKAAMRITGDPEFAMNFAIANDPSSGGGIVRIGLEKLLPFNTNK